MEAKEHLHHHQLCLPRRSFPSFFSSVAARFRITTPNAATHFPPEGRHTNPSIEEERNPDTEKQKLYSTTGGRHTKISKTQKQKNIHIYTRFVNEEVETKPSTRQQEGFFTRVGRQKTYKIERFLPLSTSPHSSK
jgi:hypothetical protein